MIARGMATWVYLVADIMHGHQKMERKIGLIYIDGKLTYTVSIHRTLITEHCEGRIISGSKRVY